MHIFTYPICTYPSVFSARPTGPSQQRCFGYFGCLQAVPSGILNIEKGEESKNNSASDGSGSESAPFSGGSHIPPSSGFSNLLLLMPSSLVQIFISGEDARNGGSLVSNNVRLSCIVGNSVGSTDAVENDEFGSGSG